MASTRNKNTQGNYCLQQKEYTDYRNNLMYKNGYAGVAYDTRLPGNGLLPGQISWDKLSRNAVDIETFLYGIGSTNLVNPRGPLVPELNCLQSANVFKKPDIYLPEPFVASKTQRPHLW